jgi:hypothetical protein
MMPDLRDAAPKDSSMTKRFTHHAAARFAALALVGVSLIGCANSSSSDWAQTQPAIRPVGHTARIIDVSTWSADDELILADDYLGKDATALP